MVERKAVVRNMQGIHLRPSAVIVKAAAGYAGDIRIQALSGSCDPRSILGLTTLALTCGDTVTILVSGPDEDAFCRRLSDLFETHYDFPPRADGQGADELLRQVEGLPP